MRELVIPNTLTVQNHTHAGHATHIPAWAWTLFGITGAISLAPHVLPLLGVQSSIATDSYMHFLGGHGDGLEFGTGLAGLINQGLASIPFVGSSLAAGGVATFAATAAIGIGGVLLANWLEKHESPNARIPWSRIIRMASLSTSLLIGLPSILGGISLGIMFLAGSISAASASYAGLALQQTLGAPSMANMGAGFSSIFAHLLSCGASLLPVGLASFLAGKSSHRAGENAAPQMQLVSATPSPLIKDVPCKLAFQLVDSATGEAMSDAQLATVHTKKLHTMIVDRTLSDYHHLHPTYDPVTKQFICRFTPRSAQPYNAWNEFTLNGAQTPTQQRLELPAAGAPELPAMIVPAQETRSGDIAITVQPEKLLRAGNSSMLAVAVRDAAGNPIRNLEPVMGADAHLVGFSQDGVHFMHCHPVSRAEDGTLRFHLAPEVGGLTKFFLHLQREGKSVIIPFGQRILSPATHADRVTASQAMPAHAARA